MMTCSDEFPTFSIAGTNPAPDPNSLEFSRALEKHLFRDHVPENDLVPDLASLAFSLRVLTQKVDQLWHRVDSLQKR